MKDYIDYDKLERLSYGDIDVNLYQKIIKIAEESGELAQAFLKYDNSKNTSASANGDIIDVIEETCDVINVAMDILNFISRTDPQAELQIRLMFKHKLNKWEKKQSNYA